MLIIYISLAFVAATAIAYIATSLIIQIAEQKQVFDLPDIRKLHIKPTPVMGGIAIFSGFWIAGLLFSGVSEIHYLAAAALILALVGITDDLISLSAYKKFIAQFIVAGILFFAGFQLQGFYGFLGFEEVAPVLSFLMTLVFLVVLTNAYNLIDGIDGLAGSQGLLGAVAFGILFAFIGEGGWSILSFALAGSIAGFLKFNFYKASIFMGDTGSTFIGLMLGVMSIQFLNAAYYGIGMVQAPVIIAAIIFVPLFDLVRVFAVRLSRGGSPFSADRIHIHHIMLDMVRFSTPLICGILGMASVAFILFAMFIEIALLAGLMLFSAFVLSFIFSVKLYSGTIVEKESVIIKMRPQIRHKTSA